MVNKIPLSTVIPAPYQVWGKLQRESRQLWVILDSCFRRNDIWGGAGAIAKSVALLRWLDYLMHRINQACGDLEDNHVIGKSGVIVVIRFLADMKGLAGEFFFLI